MVNLLGVFNRSQGRLMMAVVHMRMDQLQRHPEHHEKTSNITIIFEQNHLTRALSRRPIHPEKQVKAPTYIGIKHAEFDG